MTNRMIVALIALFIATVPGTAGPGSAAPPDVPRAHANAQPLSPTNKASIGQNYLHLGRLSDAQTLCDDALKADPGNQTAKDCLDKVTLMSIDQDLNNADAKFLSGDKAGAIGLASRWTHSGPDDRQIRARKIVRMARPSGLRAVFLAVTPDWLRQLLVTIITVVGLALILLLARKLWQEWQRGKWYGVPVKTSWRMQPLKEIPATADAQTGVPTDDVLDAINRLGHELERPIWQPKLLLLRPTPPVNYEPAIISSFRSDSMSDLILAPPVKGVFLEWQLHEIQLDQAVQNLQLKTATGIDVGSVARFVHSLFAWFNTGAPVISGVARTMTSSTTTTTSSTSTTSSPETVSIHLAARGGTIKSIAVTTSTDSAPGIDATQLSAERAAFKLLFRMRYPSLTTDEVDGFAALRQGVSLFAQYADTVPGTADDAVARTSTLAKAAFNMGFFRASIPCHCILPVTSDKDSLEIKDDVRQAVLLAEGVAHALVGTDQARISAIDCFHQLEDWPGSDPSESIRQQAFYNEAVLWRLQGLYGRCVLMLTELIGERAPDTITEETKESDAVSVPQRLKPPQQDSILLPARLARLAAFAAYNRDDWTALPEPRAQLLLDDAEKLVNDLASICNNGQASAHDRRVAGYMYAEALCAIGHVELLHVIVGEAASLYQNGRPTDLKTADISHAGAAQLHHALQWMVKCEELAPNSSLFCDMAEAYLLLKDFTAAKGYARHATLESSADSERAYYIATETFFLEGTDESKALAVKYATDFKGQITMDEFKAVRADLGMKETSSTPQTAQPATLASQDSQPGSGSQSAQADTPAQTSLPDSGSQTK